MRQPTNLRANWLLAIAVVLLAVLPLALVKGEFGGSDGQAQKAIEAIKPDYQPWVQPVFTPPSKEVESLLFAVQAALGAGVLGYVIGWYRGRQEQPNLPEPTPPQVKK